MFEVNTGISTIHDRNKHQPDTPSVGNRPVQRVNIEESIRYKCVNTLLKQG